MRYKKIFFLFLIVFMLLPIFYSSAAGIVPCGRSADDTTTPDVNESLPCTLCHLIVGTNNLITWGRNILITVAAVAIFISGIMYIVSSGNEQAVTAAKGFLRASVTGFVIVIMAWFLVNIVMWILSTKDNLGIDKVNWYTFTCVTQSTTTAQPPVTPTAYPESTTPTPTGYTYDPGIQAQTTDASATLNSLLSCMQPKLPDGAKKISSISDGNGGVNCYQDHPTWVQCQGSVKTSCCWHTKNSCHYGGRTCRGKSYAADFGNEQFSSQIMSAANSCGGKALNEGNHVHVSAGSCGCDEKI